MGKTYSDEEIADLILTPIEVLKQQYPDKQKYNAIRTLRRYHINKQKELKMENQPEKDTVANRVAELLENSGIVPEDIERISQVRVGTYQMLTKDEEGEAHIHDLNVTNVTYLPTSELDEKTFITQASPTIIKPTRRRKPTREDSMTLLAGDAQIGFRGTEPFHDEDAMELFQIAVRELQPDNVVLTGDMIDLPNMSRFEQRNDWLTTTQAAIDRYHSFLAQIRANVPHARIVVVHGNHEARMDRLVRNDAAPLLGIRRANADRELSVLTIPYLVRYEELGIEMVDGYPNAALWLEDNLKVTHGTNVAKGGSNAAKYLKEVDETTIYGHTHRMEVAYRTKATRLGHKVIAAASPGCLARIDGYVPGVNYSVDSAGNTVPRASDWQQGMLRVHHNAETHDIEAIRFQNRQMRIAGKLFRLGDEL